MDAIDERAQREDVQRRLKLASILCLIFLIAEVVGGLISGSLAILSDAAHLASDLMSFVFAVAAGHLASLSGSKTYSYGYRRWEVLAALSSMVSLAVCSIFLEGEGIRRLLPYITGTKVGETVDGGVMSIIAFIGVVVNIALALVLGVENHVHMPGDDHQHHHGHEHPESEEVVEEKCMVVVVAKVEKGSSSKKSTTFKFGDNQWHKPLCDDHFSHIVASPPLKKKEKKPLVIGCPPIKNEEKNPLVLDCPPIKKEEKKPLVLPTDSEMDQTPNKPKENINLRAAYLHVLADLAQSIAVFVAGVVIWYKPEWSIIDPLLTIIFCPIIFFSTLGVIRSSMNILLEAVPPDIDLDDLRLSISSLEGITKVCDLHVWSISHGASAMTVHATAKNPQSALRLIHRMCTRSYGIVHCTIQLEQDDRCTDCFVCGPGMTHCYDPENQSPTGGEYELVEQYDMA